MHHPLRLVAVCFFLLSGVVQAEPAEQPELARQHDFFEKQVFPLLKTHCIECHGGKKISGSLKLTSRESILKGGDTGPAIEIQDPAASLLLEAINYASYEMPPQGKLPQEEIDIITQWVKQGAPWSPKVVVAEKTEDHPAGPPQVNEETKAFWSYRPVSRPEVPQVKQQDWVRNPVDAFVLAKLEENGLLPSPPADKAELLRRVYYDMIGLPPTPEEVQAFLNDDSPDAYEKVVNRLLESPHYGEHWGRHWLDLVRYAETNSFERDGVKPFVWKYRDYVIQSINNDKPYDQFIREQLAGDELENVTQESLIATGYYRLGIWDDEPADPKLALYDDLDDVLNTTGQVFLGMTIGCARCHDHKLDPFPQADYYKMLAFFRNVRRFGVRGHESVEVNSLHVVASEEDQQNQRAQIEEHRRKLTEIEQQITQFEEELRKTFTGVEKEDFQYQERRESLIRKRVPEVITQEQYDNYVSLRRKREELKRFRPPALEQVLCVKEFGPKAPPTHILVRGNAHVEGDVVEPAFPSVLTSEQPRIPTPPEGSKTTYRRKVLADWIASEQNPLTARVMVNRIWQFHFGQGIVTSPSNFGLQGDRPTHPELLDWLASEFVQQGWRMKSLHRMILLSNTYRMSSHARPIGLEKDPENKLVWRFNPRRLTAEEIRDSILAVNGTLNQDRMFGPSIYTEIPAAVLAGQSMPGAGWGKSPPDEEARRSIYIHVKRSLLTPILASFDFPEPDFTCAVRFATTQPTQALGMLNSEFINKQARLLADFARKEAGPEVRDQVTLILKRVMQRPPTEEDIQKGLDLIESLQTRHGASPELAMNSFCLVALNLNEFIYLD